MLRCVPTPPHQGACTSEPPPRTSVSSQMRTRGQTARTDKSDRGEDRGTRKTGRRSGRERDRDRENREKKELYLFQQGPERLECFVPYPAHDIRVPAHLNRDPVLLSPVKQLCAGKGSSEAIHSRATLRVRMRSKRAPTTSITSARGGRALVHTHTHTHKMKTRTRTSMTTHTHTHTHTRELHTYTHT